MEFLENGSRPQPPTSLGTTWGKDTPLTHPRLIDFCVLWWNARRWMYEWALLAAKIILDGSINGVISIVSSFTLWWDSCSWLMFMTDIFLHSWLVFIVRIGTHMCVMTRMHIFFYINNSWISEKKIIPHNHHGQGTYSCVLWDEAYPWLIHTNCHSRAHPWRALECVTHGHVHDSFPWLILFCIHNGLSS